MGHLNEQKIFQHLNQQSVINLSLLEWAKEIIQHKSVDSTRQKYWLAFLKRCKSSAKIKFPLNGNDILELGISPGAQYGMILSNIQGWWENEGFNASRAECLEKLKSLISEINSK